MAFERKQALSSAGIPQPHSLVVAPGKTLTIRAECHRAKSPLSSFDGEEFISSLCIPAPPRLVLAGTGQLLAVRTEGHADNFACVAFKGKKALSSACVPEP